MTDNDTYGNVMSGWGDSALTMPNTGMRYSTKSGMD